MGIWSSINFHGPRTFDQHEFMIISWWEHPVGNSFRTIKRNAQLNTCKVNMRYLYTSANYDHCPHFKKLHKIRERKVKTLIKNWRVHGGQAHEHIHGNKIGNWHGRPSQSEENECMWALDKDNQKICYSGLQLWMTANDFKFAKQCSQ